MKQLSGLILLLFTYTLTLGQVKEDPAWEYKFSKSEVSVGDELELIFTTIIDNQWYMYSNDFEMEMGPMKAYFEFDAHPSYELVGSIYPIGAKHKYDDVFEGDVSIFNKKGEFRQKVKILAPNPAIKGYMEYQQCSEITGQCILFDHEFAFASPLKVNAAKVSEPPTNNTQKDPDPKIEETNTNTPEEGGDTSDSTASAKVDTNETSASAKVSEGQGQDTTTANNTVSAEGADEESSEKGESLWGFLIVAFLGGLAATLTPCVFPMLPMTVSFFTKKSDSRGAALKRAFGFGFSIIAIYVLLGFIFALLGLGPDFGNWLSTHWFPNILFFIIFIVFGASFLGMFEITLPSGFVNKVDRQSSMGSFFGVFFMAFTLVLVSFSCTGPIVGSLLIEAVGGQIMKPVLGMLAFSTAIALPFTLFAIFPSWLNNLPKSGGWLNSVKVVLGLLEIAFAFKFLSIPDQTYHWGILDREIYIAIWIVVSFILGMYLLGKIKFAHDSDIPFLSVPRMALAIVSLTFMLYLIPGMFGAPLKAIAGYLPPQHTLDFDLYTANSNGHSSQGEGDDEIGEVRFGDLFHLPHNLKGFFDWKEALAYSKKVNKPIFIDFTGHGCVNCREMEARVWSNSEVLKRLQNDYVVLALYVDDKTTLPEEEWYKSERDNRMKKTIGKQNADLQITKYEANAQPYYVLIGEDGKELIPPKAYDLDEKNFIRFLDKGIDAYQQKFGK